MTNANETDQGGNYMPRVLHNESLVEALTDVYTEDHEEGILCRAISLEDWLRAKHRTPPALGGSVQEHNLSGLPRVSAYPVGLKHPPQPSIFNDGEHMDSLAEDLLTYGENSARRAYALANLAPNLEPDSPVYGELGEAIMQYDWLGGSSAVQAQGSAAKNIYDDAVAPAFSQHGIDPAQVDALFAEQDALDRRGLVVMLDAKAVMDLGFSIVKGDLNEPDCAIQADLLPMEAAFAVYPIGAYEAAHIDD